MRRKITCDLNFQVIVVERKKFHAQIHYVTENMRITADRSFEAQAGEERGLYLETGEYDTHELARAAGKKIAVELAEGFREGFAALAAKYKAEEDAIIIH